MKLHNTLSRKVEEFEPLGQTVAMYSCGPTVYDHIHIGNLSAFIYADMLRRALRANGYEVTHVMNFTDIDDKTIRRSRQRYADLAPEEALATLTAEYKQIFLDDMQAIGNDVPAIEFTDATDNLDAMRQLITKLHRDGFAYITDDGVYFSIEKYRASGKKYGQLLELDRSNTSAARIDNDEYDKESVHDFALWKTRKEGEPAWEFELDGRDLLGRPGWHIECSAMSAAKLGQPFDIHTGGVDLIFPHHENEIAQSTAGQDNPVYAKYFVHNEHLLVEGKKMSKSLNNFFRLRDIQERGFDPLAFRLMVLQSHYHSQSNFSWENLAAAQNRLKMYRAMAVLRWQGGELLDGEQADELIAQYSEKTLSTLLDALINDLNTPQALSILSELENHLSNGVPASLHEHFVDFLGHIDEMLGLALLKEADINEVQKQILTERQAARNAKDFSQSDQLRDQLKNQGLGVRDTEHGQIWFRL